MDIITNRILQEWEKAGGEYALVAKLVRKDMEKEKEGERSPSSLGGMKA